MRKTISVDGQELLPPTFIGVGAPKCATTWISQVLRGHPNVFMSNPKELRFFAGKNWHSKELRWYLGFFEESGGYKAAGEFTTNYLVEPASAERIYTFLGPLKIIISIRNPVDRFFSHFKQKLRNGSLPQKDYEVLTLNNYHEIIEANPNLLRAGDYYEDIQRYINTFGKDRVYILVQEDIKKNAREEFSRLCEYLEIEKIADPNTLNRTVLKGTTPKNRTIHQTARRTSMFLDRYSPRLVNYLRKAGLFAHIRKLNARTADRETVIYESVRKEIAQHYAPNALKLEKLLGRPLNWNLEQIESHSA